jgi:hypothetical protein
MFIGEFPKQISGALIVENNQIASGSFQIILSQ